jgi:hypothetical protein
MEFVRYIIRSNRYLLLIEGMGREKTRTGEQPNQAG